MLLCYSALRAVTGDGFPTPPYLCLHHSRSLCSQHLYCLENIYNTLITHSFQDDTQCDEHSSPAHASTAGMGEKKETVCYNVQMLLLNAEVTVWLSCVF